MQEKVAITGKDTVMRPQQLSEHEGETNTAEENSIQPQGFNNSLVN